jgi:hydroxymethylglutaryl-CoA lyase
VLMSEIKIHEVGLRDGLQIEKQTVPLDKKIAWVEGLLAAGIDMVQLGSFVNPEKVPQMADTDKLFVHFSQAEKRPAAAILSGLVLNEKGLERGMACGVDMFCMGVSASDTHSRKNTGKSTEEAVGQIIAMAQAAMKAQKRIQVSIQSAFGCGFEGPIPAERVLSIVDRYLAAGIRNISLADTAGHATPPLRRDPEARRQGRAGLPFPQYLRSGAGQLLCGFEDRREIFRVGSGRPGRLPLH